MKDFEKLYYLHKEELYRYLLGLTHDPEQAGDLMQETFLQAMLGIGRFRQQSSVRTWLFAIGRNLWLKELRKHRETVEYDDLLETYTRQTLEETAANRETLHRIKKLMRQKDERANLVFPCVFLVIVMHKLLKRPGSAKVPHECWSTGFACG